MFAASFGAAGESQMESLCGVFFAFLLRSFGSLTKASISLWSGLETSALKVIGL
jgi:hypothetical protein